MGAALTKQDSEKRIARPLAVLVPLIKADLDQAKKAAERAGMPYYQAVGAKLLEARQSFLTKQDQRADGSTVDSVVSGAFKSWYERNFGLKHSQAKVYMALAGQVAGAPATCPPFTSLREFERETGRRKESHATIVRPVLDKVDLQALRQHEKNRQDERELQRKLALHLIDIGYKILARDLHPDKGGKSGSHEAMARLNAVRDRLKLHA